MRNITLRFNFDFLKFNREIDNSREGEMSKPTLSGQTLVKLEISITQSLKVTSSSRSSLKQDVRRC